MINHRNLIRNEVRKMFEDWQDNLYDSMFDSIFNALIAEYKEGKLDVEELKVNIAEQQQILLNAFTEGEAKSTYCNAMIDAHQFVLSLITTGKIVNY